MLIDAVISVVLVAGVPQSDNPACEEFLKLVRVVYDFKPSNITPETQKARGAEMDEVWKQVEDRPKELLPCLRALLADPKADPWFLVDGSALLVKVDPTPESKAVQAREWSRADFADIDPQTYVQTLSKLGDDGMDISVAATRWLADGRTYHLVKHGGYEVGPLEGATFLFGSMDEAQATPLLAKLAQDPKYPKRELALRLLTYQMTAESLAALKQIDLAPFPEEAKKEITRMISKPPVASDVDMSPKLSREYLLADFRGFLGEGPMHYDDDVTHESWMKAVATFLKPDDVPVLRKVRRHRLTAQSNEALEDYMVFTAALQLAAWKPELFK
ncbi:MAG: hypothetical protein HYR85_09640 [Planctomycetes bacterium]|nr:hypothetical protein [Planctomycetota bacterium]